MTTPAPTIVDWQPIETVPFNTDVMIGHVNGSIYRVRYTHGERPTATHWAPPPTVPRRSDDAISTRDAVVLPQAKRPMGESR